MPSLRSLASSILDPLDHWAFNCHGAAFELVQSGRLPECRVARGSCQGVSSQHSWVVIGLDCYDDDATIIDPTLWSYDGSIKGVWVGSYRDGRHRPHGKGNIFNWGRPDSPVGPVVTLKPRKPWSREAKSFLDLLGPLDERGWICLAHAPVEGWPAAEIIDAMCESGLQAYVPVDIVGMVTDRNPSGLYRA